MHISAKCTFQTSEGAIALIVLHPWFTLILDFTACVPVTACKCQCRKVKHVLTNLQGDTTKVVVKKQVTACYKFVPFERL